MGRKKIGKGKKVDLYLRPELYEKVLSEKEKLGFKTISKFIHFYLGEKYGVEQKLGTVAFDEEKKNVEDRIKSFIKPVSPEEADGKWLSVEDTYNFLNKNGIVFTSIRTMSKQLKTMGFLSKKKTVREKKSYFVKIV